MGKNNKKNQILPVLLSCMLLAMMIFPPVAASAATGEGSCGEGVFWKLEGGTLTISGSGGLNTKPGYFQNPWAQYLEQITEIIIEEGVTAVGDGSFYGCPNLKRVKLANSVTEIGSYAFKSCTQLKYLTLSSNLRSIGEDAFFDCESLYAVKLPEGLQSIASGAFYRCYSLTTITIPASVQSMGTQVFAYCTELLRADIQAPLQELPAGTFYECPALNGVTLAPEISDVGENAFVNCGSLTNVYCSSDQAAVDAFTQAAQQGNSDFRAPSDVENLDKAPPASKVESTTQNGVTTNVITSVDESNDATITTQQTTVTGSSQENQSSIVVSGVVENKDGWQDVLDRAESINGNQQNRPGSQLKVEVVVKDDATAPQDVLEQLEQIADQVVITTNNDTKYVLGGSTTTELENSFLFNTTVTALDAIPESLQAFLEGSRCYQVRFGGNNGYRIKVSLNLPKIEYGHVAALYAVNEKGEYGLLQSSYVGKNGTVSFYLDGIDTAYSYYIGMDPTDVDKDDVLLAEDDYAAGNLQHIKPYEQYVITGVKSSWGINVGQMTGIIIGGFVAVLGVVGYVMFLYNKQRLKKGYVPQDLDLSIDEEEVARLAKKKKREPKPLAPLDLTLDEKAVARAERRNKRKNK